MPGQSAACARRNALPRFIVFAAVNNVTGDSASLSGCQLRSIAGSMPSGAGDGHGDQPLRHSGRKDIAHRRPAPAARALHRAPAFCHPLSRGSPAARGIHSFRRSARLYRAPFRLASRLRPADFLQGSAGAARDPPSGFGRRRQQPAPQTHGGLFAVGRPVQHHAGLAHLSAETGQRSGRCAGQHHRAIRQSRRLAVAILQLNVIGKRAWRTRSQSLRQRLDE